MWGWRGAGCRQPPQGGTRSQGNARPPWSPPMQNYRVELTVQAPFSTASVAIEDSGRVQYAAEEQGKPPVAEEARVTPEKALELKQLLLSNGFMNLNAAYEDESLADATTYQISVNFGEATKTVVCKGSCPNEFKEVEDKVRELWGREIVEVGV